MNPQFLHYFIRSPKDESLSSAFAIYDPNEIRLVIHAQNETYVNIPAIERAESKIDFGPYDSMDANNLNSMSGAGGPLEASEKLFLLYYNGDKDNRHMHDHVLHILLSKNRRLFWDYDEALKYGITSNQEFSIWQIKEGEFKLIHYCG